MSPEPEEMVCATCGQSYWIRRNQGDLVEEHHEAETGHAFIPAPVVDDMAAKCVRCGHEKREHFGGYCQSCYAGPSRGGLHFPDDWHCTFVPPAPHDTAPVVGVEPPVAEARELCIQLMRYDIEVSEREAVAALNIFEAAVKAQVIEEVEGLEREIEALAEMVASPTYVEYMLRRFAARLAALRSRGGVDN